MEHKNLKIVTAGKPLEEAKGVMILIHGRGGTAEDILSLSIEFNQGDFYYIAPQANGYTWYPFSFLAPIHQNEPGISSGIAAIKSLVEGLNEQGVQANRIFVLGFSQGACLALEYAARHAQRYGGIFAFSGGLIGPDGTPRNYSGSFDETPVFLGCSDIDPHIPLSRVKETRLIFEKMGAAVTERIYPGIPHTIIQDEIEFVRQIIKTA